MSRSALAPTGLTLDPRQQLERDVIVRIKRDGNREFRQTFVQRYKDAIACYSDDAILKITAAASTDLYDALLQKLAFHHPHEGFIVDWLLFEPESRRRALVLVDPLIYGFEYYPHLAPPSEPDNRLKQGNFLIGATSWISRAFPNDVTIQSEMTSYGTEELTQYVSDERLRTLLTAHENPSAIARIMTRRRIIDPVEIAEIASTMETSPSSLTDGVL